MKKAYVIKDLEAILGCSRTAIMKKIKDNPEKPGAQRYKERFEVVSIDGKKAIMFSDEELEYEKRLSRGVKNVANNGFNTVQTDDFIDIEPEKEQNTSNELYNFTERYIEKFETFQKETYNELRNVLKERDDYAKQVYLLEDSEKRKESALMETLAENVTLKKHKTMLTVALGVVLLVLVSFITFYVTYMTLHETAMTPEELEIKKNQSVQQEIVQEIQKPVEQTVNKKVPKGRK